LLGGVVAHQAHAFKSLAGLGTFAAGRFLDETAVHDPLAFDGALELGGGLARIGPELHREGPLADERLQLLLLGAGLPPRRGALESSGGPGGLFLPPSRGHQNRAPRPKRPPRARTPPPHNRLHGRPRPAPIKKEETPGAPRRKRGRGPTAARPRFHPIA